MRIALVSPVFPHPRGGVHVGIERHSVELVRQLASRGHDVTICTSFWNGGAQQDEFEGVRILRATDLSSTLGRFAAVLDLHYRTWGMNVQAQLAKLGHLDIVHALAPLSSASRVTSKSAPLLTHFHHYEAVTRPMDLLHRPSHHMLERKAYRDSTLVAALSRYGAQSLARAFGIPPEAIRIIPDGVDLDRFSPKPRRGHRPPRILHVGAHERRKGLVYLIRALGLLRERRRDFRAILVGVGPETPRLKELARKLDLDARVSFEGYVNPLDGQLAEFYRRADLVVHPSLEEGFGMVLAEAMASGVPVVASRCGAIPEVVGDASILVPPRDPSALAEAIESVLTNPEQGRTLGSRGRRRAESLYSWDTVAERTLEVYKEAIRCATA